jgi:hypothetical protein
MDENLGGFSAIRERERERERKGLIENKDNENREKP